MNIFQLYCLLYISILLILICIAVKEIREVIYDMYDLLIKTPLLYIKSYCRRSSEIKNPIEYYTMGSLTEKMNSDVELPLRKEVTSSKYGDTYSVL